MELTTTIGNPDITAPKTLRHTFATILQDANVDPLIRNELMGHAPMASIGGVIGLGMTAHYTHSRPETKRQQLERAMLGHPAIKCAEEWLARKAATHISRSPDVRAMQQG
jgi:site-specific recombinase XerD